MKSISLHTIKNLINEFPFGGSIFLNYKNKTGGVLLATNLGLRKQVSTGEQYTLSIHSLLLNLKLEKKIKNLNLNKIFFISIVHHLL